MLGGDVPAAYVTAYWGKARPAGGGGPDWDPLANHCLDVAAAGEALLCAAIVAFLSARSALLLSLCVASYHPAIHLTFGIQG
jgi:hypothetical protein